MFSFRRFLLFGLFVASLSPSIYGQDSIKDNSSLYNEQKIVRVIDLVRRYYVESTNLGRLSEKAISSMLKELDPHSTYISREEVAKMNEPLIGNFDGIGVAFQIMKDTILVVEVINGGPSEKVGLLSGDKIIKVDDKPATGDSIKNDWVFKHLRGKKGSEVNITVRRKGRTEPILFKIIRDKIPIHSIETSYMLDENIGYIKLDRFAQTSQREFRNAIGELKKQGMKSLIFDLRGNGGGFLDVAFNLCDEFLEKGKLIVYTEGATSPRYDYYARNTGVFEKGRLVVLIDEGSASASEIVSGAVQDWDRGFVIGRRTFGKGLVQRPFDLPDASQIRLTTSRYYTPAGRCIQKPYDDGLDAYYNDYMKRLRHKEFVTPDSISFPDSLKYQTSKGRVVYGGGGIMPDIFVPIDTSRASDYLIDLRSKGLFNNFVLEWSNDNRKEFLERYPTYEAFAAVYDSLNLLTRFEEYAKANGVHKNTIHKEWVNRMVVEYLSEKIKDTSLALPTSYVSYANNLFEDENFARKVLAEAAKTDEEAHAAIAHSEKYIAYVLQGMVARSLYGISAYFKVMRDLDDGLQKALEVIRNDSLFGQDHCPIFQEKKK